MECSTGSSKVRGVLQVWDILTDDWFNGSPGESTEIAALGSYYGCYTPDNSNRRLFPLTGTGHDWVSSDGYMIMRRAHFSDVGAFVSSYDLVQVIPYAPVSSPFSDDSVPSLQADVIFDDEVNADDLAMFYNSFIAAAPIADADQDQVVDALDVQAFLADYADEGP